MSGKRAVSLYIRDEKEYKALRDEVKNLWYKKYGIALSIGEVVMYSLNFTKEELLKTDKSRNNQTPSKKYSRLSS